MWAIAYLNGRRMISIPLARTGDSERRGSFTHIGPGAPA